MMVCPKCHSIMKHVYRFTPDHNYELDICKSCYFETKPKLLKIDAEEIIQDKTDVTHKKKVVKSDKNREKKQTKKHAKGKKR